MARLLDSEGVALREIFDGMQPDFGRWMIAVENPATQPPVIEVYFGERNQEFPEFKREISHVPEEWAPLDAALVFQVSHTPPVIELTEDLLALVPPEIRPDAIERGQRRSILESIIGQMAEKQGIQLRRSTPPSPIV